MIKLTSLRRIAKNRKLILYLLIASLLTNIVAIATPLVSGNTEISHRYQQILQSVFFYIENYYVDPMDEKVLLIGSIRGALASTGDPYTRFLDRNETEEFSSAEEGQRIGIGVEVTMQNGVPLIIAPIEGGPADRAGIKSGDRIVKIDGKATDRLTFGELLKSIGGQSGTVVNLEVAREGRANPVKIRVARALIDLDYCRVGEFKEDRVGYIRLIQFFGEDSGTVDKFKNALIDYKKKGYQGVIIDLRNDTGGHLNMAVTLASYFLKPDQIVVKARGRTPAVNQDYFTQLDNSLVPESMRVVVLVNRGSASASEIFAGALQDYKRATLVGTRSFGKASVQQIVRPLPDDTSALITIQRYYTPLSRSIHGVGLTPDIEVDEIRPDDDEGFYIRRMNEAKFIPNFIKANPSYSHVVFESFQASIQKRGWILSDDLAKYLLKTSYPNFKRDPLDLELDPQLRRAVAVARGER